ncbi:MAG: hypothetical protein H6833_04500 [Planctomycetes bacterium]|nr:hypothetical protein [Planctomycetota bacterium]
MISGLGLLTSVGHDAPTSCASIRAGLSRPSEHPAYRVLDDETQDVVPVTAHPITCFTEGYYLLGFWLRGGVRAVQEALRDSRWFEDRPAPDPARSAVIAIVPHVDDDRYLGDSDTDPSFLLDAYVAPLLTRVNLDVPSEHRELVVHGHASVFFALERASRWIRESDVERVLIVAVDTQLDSLTLDWLAGRRRLKSADEPSGLAPGEAACALVVERRDPTARRDSDVILDAVRTGKEERHCSQDEPNLGQGLAAVVDGLRSDGLGGEAFDGDLIVDLNGETWRAREFGFAQHRVPWLHEPKRILLPASSVGDTGVAAGVLNVCVGAMSQRRGYGARSGAVVLGSSERGDLGGAWLRSSRESV